MKRSAVRLILFALPSVLRLAAARYPAFRAALGKHDCVVQIRLKDRSLGRYFAFKHGRISSKAGFHPKPHLALVFRDIETAAMFLVPPLDWAKVVHAAKNFLVVLEGRDELAVWFMQLIHHLDTVKLQMGTRMPDGTVRFTSNTNGGPLFVYVKDGRIVRCTPIDFVDTDAPSWTITARGRSFSPKRQATVNPHALTFKSQVYSERRCLYPMKRVDFDPEGERNAQNRGKSEYVRITWDEALDIMDKEITRQQVVHGPGSILVHHGSHHQWGNVNYYLSAFQRFGNLIGVTRAHHNPDSWEGWYWGAQHHYGSSLRVGIPGFYGTVEDCLKEAEMIVFWSSDPETTAGAYGAFEGTERRFWAKELGIEFVHIDPHFNPTAQLYGGRWIPVRPGTDAALAAAIMQVWIVEGLYDKEYVRDRTTGFELWRAYLLGDEDGVPKTPEWQEAETGVAAHVVRALARAWGGKKTYLAAGGKGTGYGGACRSATGSQWARSMILLMAMQGWGKPGVNFGNLTVASPVDYYFYFPGYADGGISGDLTGTGAAISNYVRMPHILTMNPVKQMVPRQRIPEAIIEGKAQGYLWDGTSLEAQFTPIRYPAPGYSKVHMLYRYGASVVGTIAESGRFLEAYRHPSLEFMVSQALYFEGDAQFADLILPACTVAERYDIGETASAGGYSHHGGIAQLNHRTIVFQHKCIEPLGESKSDYQIFLEILQRRGLGALFSEGCSELDWCKRQFDSSDLPRHMSWEDFVRKGYYVVPAEPEKTRDPAYMRWYAEGRLKDVPEPHPFPAQYSEYFGKGLQTQSGKIEFEASSIKRGDPDNPERPPLNRYVPSWEGPHAELYAKYPLQMIATHSRYSFHTFADGKGTSINDIEDHRVLIDGYYYWVIRLNSRDARARAIGHHDLVRVFNDRAAVICAADVSPLMTPGAVKTFESSAELDLIDTGSGLLTDRGGCMNLLTPRRPQVKGTEGMGSNSCLVEVEKWPATSRESAKQQQSEGITTPEPVRG